MVGPGIEAVNVTDQAKSQITWWINEVAQEYDLSQWSVFLYGYPERAALEMTLTSPDRVKVQRQFSERQLNGHALRELVEDAYDAWRRRASRR